MENAKQRSEIGQSIGGQGTRRRGPWNSPWSPGGEHVDGKGWDDSRCTRFDRDNGDGDRRQEGSLIGRAPIA